MIVQTMGPQLRSPLTASASRAKDRLANWHTGNRCESCSADRFCLGIGKSDLGNLDLLAADRRTPAPTAEF